TQCLIQANGRDQLVLKRERPTLITFCSHIGDVNKREGAIYYQGFELKPTPYGAVQILTISIGAPTAKMVRKGLNVLREILITLASKFSKESE
ncbi:MAG TPA: hypothetical protein VK589_09495, partial [Chryseolinea sp.]|nr:hypothetical protein [Chryseolinea sp.]